MKRAAAYDIDPVTFEEKQRVEEKDSPIDPEGAHMKNRKIYKITKPDNSQDDKPKAKPSLFIPGLSLNQSQHKEEAPKQDKKTSLFGNSNIFSSSNDGGIFSNILKPERTNTQGQSKEKVQSTSLFGNNGVSLFGSGNSIFGNSGSLFGGNSASGSLFGNNPSASGSIFGSIASKSLFGNNKNQEQQEGDSAELEKDQIMKIDPSKTTKFQYDQQCQVLKKVKISKFKKDKGDLIDSPLLAILLSEKQSKTVYLTVQLETTHKTIFSGFILPSKSQIRVLNNKSENIEVHVFSIAKDKKLEKHVIRLQIADQNTVVSKEFFEAIRQIIENKVVKSQ